ncbi:hypothetical protein EV690_0689 [Celerinatantimonas diazotrophica]|uniref:Uncharacterized protein n=1 Tax=Celerinatantimonas diazotrophica TaxID=412034 RepID=A0A4R1K3T0_9GAMM|nr:hypothetical protein EV690_0689 [Celerinatantimonas diazotrophica]CAG9297189.1 hypothetical protein CEDIAZO_02359 [Celerinatantimonas diazotrophica]
MQMFRQTVIQVSLRTLDLGLFNASCAVRCIKTQCFKHEQ